MFTCNACAPQQDVPANACAMLSGTFWAGSKGAERGAERSREARNSCHEPPRTDRPLR